VAEALWELKPNSTLQQEQLQSDVKVTLHTAVLWKSYFPGYTVARGPEVSFNKEVAFS
jgi:hypothetical protein